MGASLLPGCAPAAGPADGPGAAGGRLKVFVSILPEAFFVERIGGEYVSVVVLVGPGQSPHTYEPTPKQMVQVSQARLFFAIGWPFEKQLLDKIADQAPNMKVIDLRQGITLRHMTTAEELAESADEPSSATAPPSPPAAESRPAPTGQPAPTGLAAGEPDPHIWLSPRNARLIAATVARALSEANPAHAGEFKKNLDALDADLAQLDGRIAAALAPLKGRDVFAYHPAFGYFLEAYGLNQVPVEIEGKEPTARQLVQLIARAKAEGVRVIFVQPQFSTRSAETVAAAIGGVVVPMDDLSKDYLTNLADMAEKVRQALGATP
jgi:zinc transport system substrate-binding protein